MNLLLRPKTKTVTATTTSDGLGRARRRHFLSDYELATPTRPPTAPPAIRTVQPRSVQLGQSFVDVKLSFVIFPSSSSEVGGVTFPIHVTKTCTFTLQQPI